MKDNYNNIAFIYDRLNRLIFGKAQIKAQTALLPYIKNGDRLLIVGGGTGWILEEIANIHPAGLEIDFIDSSERMLSQSKKRYFGLNKITFIHQAVEETELKHDYNVIISGFFFDNFMLRKAESIFMLLDSKLISGGLWLFADFTLNHEKGLLWKRAMLQFMYFFFRIVCKIEATQLIEMEPIFKQAHYQPIFKMAVYGNFIESVVYEKQ
jgi:cyclopropane fatty-acyl-phospholipid synthase-like methyltransferase